MAGQKRLGEVGGYVSEIVAFWEAGECEANSSVRLPDTQHPLSLSTFCRPWEVVVEKPSLLGLHTLPGGPDPSAPPPPVVQCQESESLCLSPSTPQPPKGILLG